MRPTFIAIPLMLTASAASADDAMSSTERADAVAGWELSTAVGVSSVGAPLPGMQIMGEGTVARSTTGMAVAPATTLEPTGLFSLRYRVRDRLLWSIPTLSFAYLGGTAGEREWIPWGGLTGWGLGYSSIEGLIGQGQVGGGVAEREWLRADTAVNVTAGVGSAFVYTSQPVCDGASMCPTWQGPSSWTGTASAGITYRANDTLTLNVGVGGSQRLLVDGALPGDRESRRPTVMFGSVQEVGLRLLPLVQARVSDHWLIDGYAAAAYDLGRDRYEQRYLVGFTREWLR